MSAIETAKELYLKWGSLRPFEQDLCDHLEHGYVAASPGVFAMARPVRHDAQLELLARIDYEFERPDCWLIWSAVGPLFLLIELLPFPLPLIAFHRTSERRRGRSRLRVYRTDRLLDLARTLPQHTVIT